MRKRHSIPTVILPGPKDKPKGQKRKGKTVGDVLVAWYVKNHRILPWRAAPGACQAPYKTWLSEIMLQQTTVQTVVPYYNKFLTLWPTVDDLAAADEDSVLLAWAGLGYYSRARNLHKCARVIVQSVIPAERSESRDLLRVKERIKIPDRPLGVRDDSSVFPNTYDGLLALPGIGPYTAAAVGAMAFGLSVVPVDGNVERVMTRLYAIDQPVAVAKPRIKALAQDMLDNAPGAFPGDFAQALMDLGATICTPKSPKCGLCPLRAACAAYQTGTPTAFPVPAPKGDKPTRCGVVYMVYDSRGRYAVLKRGDKGLLAGMMGLPTTEWIVTSRGPRVSVGADIGQVRHSFTHFNLILDVVRVARADYVAHFGALDGAIWHKRDILTDVGLPRVFHKATAFLK
jgi:A/G-specific adenine glycosylase